LRPSPAACHDNPVCQPAPLPIKESKGTVAAHHQETYIAGN